MQGTDAHIGVVDGLLLGAAALLIASITACLSSPSQAGAIEWGDTVIGTNVTNSSFEIILSGDLSVVSGGNLTLSHCVLYLNASDPEGVSIVVEEGGALNLIASTLAILNGSYDVTVRGRLTIESTPAGGLYGGNPGPSGGIVVAGPGRALLNRTMLDSPLGPVLVLSSGAEAQLERCVMSSNGTVLLVEGGSSAFLYQCDTGGRDAGPVVTVRDGSRVVFEGSHINPPPEMGIFSSSAIGRGTGLLVEGSASMVTMRYCGGVDAPYIVKVVDGSFKAITNPEYECHIEVDIIESERGNVTLDHASVMNLSITDGSLWLLNGSTYRTGLVSGDSTVHSYGIAPSNSTLAPTVTLHHHYRVDFLLLNDTRAPAPDNTLLVETKYRDVVIDTRSGPDGWVRGVWLLSWTRKGPSFTYEPPHRVEFGDVDYSITMVQVYGNTTVTLWNSPDQRDLVLLQDAVTITDRSPREGDPFDVLVKGSLMVPYAYPTGETELVLYIDGKPIESKSFSPTSRTDVTFKGLNLSEGLHEVRVVVDPAGLVPQLNRNGNDEARVMVEVASRDYTGDEIDLYVRVGRIEDTAGNAKPPLLPGVLDVHFTVRARYSTVVQRNVQVQLLVDGEVRGTSWVDLISLVDVDGVREYSSDGHIPINLPEGTYTIELAVDPGDDFIERYENNNVASTTVDVKPKAVKPFLDNWDDPALCIVLGTVALVIAILAVTRSRLSRRGRGAMPGPGAPPAVPSAWAGPAPAPPAPLAPPVPLVPPVPPAFPAPSHGPREASPLAGATCPSCGGSDVVGYPDGSARCQGCKAVFYMR